MATPAGEVQLLQWFDELSNWGRWGAEDRLGTLNLITDDHRAAAAQLARTGQVVSCALAIDPDGPFTGHHPPQRMMIRSGEGLADRHRVPPRHVELAGRGASAIEYIGMVFHGDGITHLDALGHMFWDGRAYNGVPAERINAEFGATELPVTAASSGIMTRGVLLDVAALHGVDWLAPGTAVTPHDLADAEAREQVAVGNGDVVFLRTGHGALCRSIGTAQANIGPRSGWAAQCLPWLRQRDVAVAGSDTVNDPLPVVHPQIALPLHYLGIVGMGLWLLDNCDLEELSRMCHHLGRFDFLCIVSPLRLVGSTGSPVNPLACF